MENEAGQENKDVFSSHSIKRYTHSDVLTPCSILHTSHTVTLRPCNPEIKSVGRKISGSFPDYQSGLV